MGVDSGLFSYQRVTANAISLSPHPSGGLISVMLAVPGCRVRLGACTFTGVRPVIGQPAYTLETAEGGTPTSQGSALSSALQLSTQLPHLLPNPGVEPHRDEDPGLEELTDLGMGHKPEPVPNRAHWAVPSFDQ